MKYIQLFEDFDDSENSLKQLYNTLKQLMDDSYKCELELKDDTIIATDGKMTITIKDNNKPNDFYIMNVEGKDGEIRLKSDEGGKDYESPDQVPSDSVLMYIGQYFQQTI